MTEELNYIAEGLRALAVPIDELHVDPANARTGHALERIAASLKAYGQRKPIIANRLQNGKIEAGNKKSLKHISASGFLDNVIVQLFIFCVWVVYLFMADITQGFSVVNLVPKFWVIFPFFDVVRTDFIFCSTVLASVIVSLQNSFPPMVISPSGVKPFVFLFAFGFVSTFLTAILCSQVPVIWREYLSAPDTSKGFSWSVYHGVQFTATRKRTSLLVKLRGQLEGFITHYAFTIMTFRAVITSRVVNSEHLPAVFASALKREFLHHSLLANLHRLWRFAWFGVTIDALKHTTTGGNQVDRFDHDLFNVKAVFAVALELFRRAIALSEIVAERFNVAGQLKDGVGGVGIFEVFKQSFNGGFTKAFGELRGDGQNGKIRHGGTPFGVGDSAVRLIKFTQTSFRGNVTAVWFRACGVFSHFIGSIAFGKSLLFDYFETLASRIFNQSMNYLGIQASVISLGTFYKCCMKGFKNSQGKFFHDGSITALCRHCQGVANAVSVETGTGQEEKRELHPQVYQLGKHRLMCGDSTQRGDVERLMAGELAQMIWTDAPWNVNYGGGEHPTYKKRTINNDNLGEKFAIFVELFVTQLWRFSVPGAMLYAVMGGEEWPLIDSELRKIGFHWSSTIVWVKDQMVLSRKDYHAQYEPIWYGWKNDAPRVCEVPDRKQSDVWQIDRPRKSEEHPTMKPVDLVERSLLTPPKPGDIVLDLFSGSGTTLAACERTGRVCYAMDNDPKYIAEGRERWHIMTGQHPVLEEQ